jgi:hypothetical protein
VKRHAPEPGEKVNRGLKLPVMGLDFCDGCRFEAPEPDGILALPSDGVIMASASV